MNNNNIIRDNNNTLSLINPLNENYINGNNGNNKSISLNNQESNFSISNNLINSKVDNLLMAIDSSKLPLPKIKVIENNLYLTGCKNVFKNQLSILKNNNKKIYKTKKSINFSFEENINKIITTNKSIEYDKHNNNKEQYIDKFYKKPFKPNLNQLIKHNGILIPSNNSYRVKKNKKKFK